MLKEGASNSEIIELMKHPSSGVGFLSQHPSLPSHTFVSADAIQWLITHTEGTLPHQQAVFIMEVRCFDT